jgi:hypothetical protein
MSITPSSETYDNVEDTHRSLPDSSNLIGEKLTAVGLRVNEL